MDSKFYCSLDLTALTVIRRFKSRVITSTTFRSANLLIGRTRSLVSEKTKEKSKHTDCIISMFARKRYCH